MTTHSKNLRDNLGGNRFSPLTREEELALGARLTAARAAGDDKAVRKVRDELIERHLRLVYAIAKGYEHRMPPEDAFAVGAAALTEAMERWNPQPGAMSSYQWAKRWITTALNKATDAERVIRLPEQVAYRASGATKAVREAETRLGRRLTDAERTKVTEGTSRLEDYPRVDASLETPVYASGEHVVTVGDVLATNTTGPEEAVEKTDIVDRLWDALEMLTTEEKLVLVHRFGLLGAEVLTLSQLGEQLGACGEAVRRLEATALAKLQHPANDTLTMGDLL